MKYSFFVGSFFGVAGRFPKSLWDWRRVQRTFCVRRLHSRRGFILLFKLVGV